MNDVVQKLKIAIATLDPKDHPEKYWEAKEILNRLTESNDEEELNFYLNLAKNFRPKYYNGRRVFDYVEELKFPFPTNWYMSNDTSIIGVSDTHFIHYNIENGIIKFVEHEKMDIPDPIHCDNNSCWLTTSDETIRCNIHSGDILDRKKLAKSKYIGIAGDQVIYSNEKFTFATDANAALQLETLSKVADPDYTARVSNNLFFTFPVENNECKLGQIHEDQSIFIFANSFPRENHQLLICGDNLILIYEIKMEESTSTRIFLL